MNEKQGVLRPDVQPDDHQSGPPDAPVTLVQYGDFQCPWCFKAHPIVLALQQQFGATLRFVYRNFPLTEIHPRALPAALAAESVAAAGGNDAYWRMHHLIYEHQQDGRDALDDHHLARYGAEAGVDAEQVRRDIATAAFEERVNADFMSGVRSGVNGTPTFFINGERFDGDWLNGTGLADAIEVSAHPQPH